MTRPDPILIAPNAPDALAPWLQQHKLTSPLLVCDEVTYSAAAHRLATTLQDSGFVPRVAKLTGRPVLADEIRIFETLLYLTPEIDAVVSVGSGTITDIGRFVSHRGNRPFIAVPTAASVDGFYSIGAPLIVKGVKRTIICRPPEALFVDTDTILSAPRRLTAAGFGDLLGKITSWADWNLGRILWQEPFSPDIADRLASVAQKILTLATEIRTPDAETLQTLMDLLIVSGSCMVDARESRPASGAEHHLSHYWEMGFLQQGEEPPLHGAKVGYATQLVAALYRHLLTISSREAESLIDRSRQHSEEREIHRGYPTVIADQLITDHEVFLKQSPEEQQALRHAIVEQWEDILDIARRVPEPATITAALQAADGPTRAADLGIDSAAVEDALKYAHYLRNRFTILKLYRVLGIDPLPVGRAALEGEW